MKVEINERKSGKIYQMRGRTQFRGKKWQNSGGKKNGRDRSKLQEKANGRKYYVYGKLGHFISECHEEKYKKY